MSQTDRIPVLGALLRRVRGVWSLPIWRQAMRDDIARLAQQQESLPAMQAQLDDITARLAQLEDANLARRIDRLRAGEASQLRHSHELQAKLQGMQRRLDVLAAAWPSGGEAVQGGDASQPADRTASLSWVIQARAPLAAERLAAAQAALAPRLAADQGISAPVLDLPPSDIANWTSLLHDHPVEELQRVVVADGFDRLQRTDQGALLALIRQRLKPGGWLAVGMANPENLLELAVLCRSPLAGPLHPTAAIDLAAAAGLAEATVQRCDWPVPDTPVAPSEDVPLSPLDTALQAARRFWLIAKRAD